MIKLVKKFVMCNNRCYPYFLLILVFKFIGAKKIKKNAIDSLGFEDLCYD